MSAATPRAVGMRPSLKVRAPHQGTLKRSVGTRKRMGDMLWGHLWDVLR